MKNLNSKILSQLKVLKPPLELQTEFVTIVEKVEALKEKYQNSLNDLETLYGALSQKAFKGELDLSRIAISEELKPKDIKMDAPQVRNPDLTVQDESVKTQETREQFLMSGRRTEKTRTIF
jgi:type I restriction enzyme S subunit